MDIFGVENNRVVLTPQALNIKEFKDIWDDHEQKEEAIAELSYVEFMCSLKKTNPFVGYLKDELRKKKILEALPVEIDPSGEKIGPAMKMYKQLQKEGSPTVVMYEATLSATEKLIDFMRDVDLTKTGPRGQLLYRTTDVIKTITEAESIIKNLSALKEKVYSESYEASKGKAGREINYFEKAPEN